jgi:OmpA family protein
MSRFIRIVLGGAAVSLAVAAIAQQPIIYPAKGQSPEQQSKDEGECYVWAKQSTGIDPVALAGAPVQAQQKSSGRTVVGGAATGAAGGAAIGAIAGNAGKGAAIGAVVGTMGGMHRANANQASANQQAQAGRQDQLHTFNRAQAACLGGRGYTVQ